MHGGGPEHIEIVDLAEQVLHVLEIVAPGGVLFGQEILDNVAEALDSDTKPVKSGEEPLRITWRCNLYASVQRSRARC